MVPMIAFMLLACNPAGSAFKEADQLAADGKYDEAIVKYDQVQHGWPDSPEARMAPASIDRAMIGQIKERFAAEDWEGVGVAMTAFNKHSQDSYQAFAATPEGEGAYVAAMWVDFRNATSDSEKDNLLNFVVKHWPKESGALSVAIAKDTCARRTEFPAWKACDGLPKPDLGPNVHAPPDVASITDGTALAAAIAGCEKVAPLKDMCPDAAEAFSLLPDVGSLKAQQDRVAEAEAGPVVKRLNDLAAECETAKKRRRAVEDKWAPQVMAGSVWASGQFMVEERPYNDKVAENGGKVGDIQRSLKDKGWPEATTRKVADAATAADKACSW